jgi:predicted nucleotidyltransferase
VNGGSIAGCYRFPVDRERLLSCLSAVLAQSDARSWLQAALLFGSAARGSMRPHSDVDVGVVPVGSGPPLANELALQVELSLASGREVDLVRLDQAGSLVRWEVARDGVTLYSAPAGAAARFRAEAALEHAELAPLIEQGAEVWRNAVLRRARR